MENTEKKWLSLRLVFAWQQSAIQSCERKRNPRCVANLHCECQGLKPKGEKNSLFLLLHPSSGEDAVNTVESHFN